MEEMATQALEEQLAEVGVVGTEEVEGLLITVVLEGLATAIPLELLYQIFRV